MKYVQITFFISFQISKLTPFVVRKGSSQESATKKRVMRQHLRLLFTVSLASLALGICWLPFCVINVINLWATTTPRTYFFVAIWCCGLNSAIKTVLYAFNLQHIKKAYLKPCQDWITMKSHPLSRFNFETNQTPNLHRGVYRLRPVDKMTVPYGYPESPTSQIAYTASTSL